MKNDSSSSNDSDIESDSSDEESKDDPVLQISSIPHYGTINRIRVYNFMFLNYKILTILKYL